MMTLAQIETATREELVEAIATASRDERNWAWRDHEDSCSGADICDPDADAGSMWCGTLTVPSLGITIGYGFCVSCNRDAEITIEYGSGERDGDCGEIRGRNSTSISQDLAWEAGHDVDTPGLADVIRDYCIPVCSQWRMKMISATLQRAWVPIIRDAIAQCVADGRDEADYGVDGYTVLVSRENSVFSIGLYLPGSAPEGTCDAYYTCAENGEAIA